MNEMLLDRAGDAPIPEGYQLIDSEVAFLQRATENGCFVVRGPQLCRWASEFWHGRGIPYGELASPTEAIQQLVPHLTAGQAQKIGAALPQKLLPDLGAFNITGLLQALFPNALWETRPSKNHAADWLLWLYKGSAGSAFEPLLVEQSRLWQREVDDATYKVYGATNSDAALALLEIWLGVNRNPLLNELGIFPQPIPAPVRNHVIKAWKHELISRRGVLVEELEKLPLPRDLIRLAAQETVSYLEHDHHRAYLTKALHSQLTPYLSTTDQQHLLKLAPPDLPGELPSEPTAVLGWFRDHYLPARQWQVAYGSEEDRAALRAAARQFIVWYLEQYPRALLGGPLAGHLSFKRAAGIKQRADHYVTLLLVLDGLHLPDAGRLILQIQSKTVRLTLVEDGLAFAPLPTVTEFCKPALLAGVAPEVTANVPTTLGPVLSANSSPTNALSRASAGDLYIWRILEPDHTYHQQNSSDTLWQDIEGRLYSIAGKIANIVRDVPGELPLRLIVTTDHGRLLTRSYRNLPVPAGMTSHGRAAWGASDREFDGSGFAVEDDIVYLHAGRFGVPAVAAIALDEDSFRTNDDRSGSEWYPHGGLYPEEVIVPWIELVRDMELPRLTVSLSGSGPAGKSGTLSLYLRNPEPIAVTVNELLVITGSRQQKQLVNLTVPAMDEISHSIPLPIWPSQSEIESVTVRLNLSLPNKLSFTVTIDEIQLESVEMYQRDDILGDLDL
jgi:hypothetical protein